MKEVDLPPTTTPLMNDQAEEARPPHDMGKDIPSAQYNHDGSDRWHSFLVVQTYSPPLFLPHSP